MHDHWTCRPAQRYARRDVTNSNHDDALTDAADVRRPPAPAEQSSHAVCFHPGATAMSVLAWVKLTVCLWLLRKAVKVAWWLLLAALAVAAWPVTLVAVTGY